MTNTNATQDLVERIERLVQEHISEIHVAAQAAIARAFASSRSPRRNSAPEHRQQRSSCPRKRRASNELAEIGERLYEAVRTRPGETMAVLGPVVGGTARELSRPMMRLKRAGRVRVVGTRSAARYFPMASEAAAAE